MLSQVHKIAATTTIASNMKDAVLDSGLDFGPEGSALTQTHAPAPTGLG